jgi:hypothetical protein
LDDAGGQNVSDCLYFAIDNYFHDLWTMGIRVVPRFTDMAGGTSGIWYLGLTCLSRNNLAEKI